jgi:hypothetical protein
MKSTDLRIGNLILPGTVTSLSDNGVIKVYDGYGVFSSDKQIEGWLQGQPIGKELLIDDFGFKENEQGYEHELGAAKIICRSNSDKWYFEIGALYLGEIKYIHQVQNIYHSIMGRELK